MSQDGDKTELITRKVVDFLNIVLDSEHTQDFEYALKTDKTWFSTVEGQHFFGLDKEGVKRYGQLTNDILRMKPWNRLSLRYVTNQMDEIFEKSLSKIVESERSGILPKALIEADIDDVREQVRSLAADLDREASKEWIVYLPLAGISGISGNSLKIGRACLKYMNSVEIDALCGKIGSILVKEPAHGDKSQIGRDKFLRGRIEALKDNVCAIYQIIGESDKAIEIAEEQTQDALDLLTYYISFIHSRDYGGAVRPQGEMVRGQRTTLLLSPTTDSFHLVHRLTGAYMPIEFAKDDIKAMKAIGIFDVSAIIEAGRPTQFQKTVIAGIRWFAASQRQDTPEIEFVNLVTCLENCLTPNGGSPIGASIAEGCAMLLRDKLEQRLELKATVLEIYGIRSKIVHRGGSITSKREKSRLADLRRIARALLAVLIKCIDEFKEKKDLLTWIESQKLTPK
jgi:hypothetical protein